MSLFLDASFQIVNNFNQNILSSDYIRQEVILIMVPAWIFCL
jgi:hypothetical protein